MGDFDRPLNALDDAVREVRTSIADTLDVEAGLGAIVDRPETHRHKPERGRLTTRGRSTADDRWTTLLVVHEIDDSWTIHGLGAPGVTLHKVDMIALAESILARAR